MFASLQRKTLCVPSCQALENRVLLAATLVDGVLKVVGTEGDEDISVTGPRRAGPEKNRFMGAGNDVILNL